MKYSTFFALSLLFNSSFAHDDFDTSFMNCWGATSILRRVPLECYKQWREETGYWIGELTLYQADGSPYETSSFNYPYDSYKGFITGSIDGLSYRQRNVFLYPPQTEEKCALDNSVTGVQGTCGVNGNSRIFSADQTASATDRYGTISGEMPGGISTSTTLVGDESGLLYQVFIEGELSQSQLTTLTEDPEGNNIFRTRTAQGFVFGRSAYASFYRERRVTEEEFYNEMNATLQEYNILDSDACTTNGFGGFATGYEGGFDDCKTHLEESFTL